MENELIKLSNEIYFVTGNKGKVASANKLFEDINIKIFDYDLVEPRSDDIKIISEYKVKEAYDVLKKPCIAHDSGFFIDELNGFPRAFVHYALDTIGIEGILKLMDNVHNRKCRFKECLTYYDGKNILYFYGNHEGILADSIRGNDSDVKWSELWYIFIPYGYNKTLSEMTDEERNNRIRCKENNSAMSEFKDYYEKTKVLIK